MKPLLAHIYEPHRVTYPCYVQPKLNGIRALYQNGHFQSRDEIPFPKGLLDHLVAPLLDTFESDVVLDGELYVHGWPLQRINAAVTPVRQRPTEDTKLVEYHVFDVVDFTKSFEERRCIIDTLWPCDRGIRIVPTAFLANERITDEYYASYVGSGFEGMMYRLGDCPYTVPRQTFAETSSTIKLPSPSFRGRAWSDKDNRCWHLLKRKDWQDDEFVCVGVQEGEGKYQETLGALTCRINPGPGRRAAAEAKHWFDHAPTFSVGSGLTDAERDHYWANPPIGRLVKVKYLVLSSDGIPLNPTIIAIL